MALVEHGPAKAERRQRLALRCGNMPAWAVGAARGDYPFLGVREAR